MLGHLIRYYVYSNVHISLCALSFVMGAYAFSGLPFNMHYCLFVSSSTLVSYNLHRLIGLSKASNRRKTERFRYLIDHKVLIGITIIIGVLIMVYCGLNIDRHLFYLLSVLGLITGLYLLPILQHKKRLRDLPFIKIAAISIVWSAVFLLPLIHANEEFSTLILVLIFIEKALFIFALTVPFDVRDVQIDNEQSVKTIATKYTPTQLKYMIFWSLMVCTIINISLYHYSIITSSALLALIALYLLQYILSYKAMSISHELYFLGLLDGLILINGLIYFI